jgi:hypothetical protein
MIQLINSFRNAKQGDLIRVNDVDLLIELDDASKGKLPDFTIKEKRSWRANLSEYIVLTLDHVGSDIERLLMCSVYKDACDVKLYNRPDFFVPDRRNVLMESANGWLFDFDSYPQEIYNGDIVYKKKFQNEMFPGNGTPKEDFKNQITSNTSCIVEWETPSKIVDYQLLVIETGSTNQYGGWVEFYQGRQIKNEEVVF